MNKKINILDTFSGAGGFSLGFQMAGYNIIGAIEIDKWASDTFKFNHKDVNVLKEDITKLTDKQLKKEFNDCKPDIILGGPPCQGFSICNIKNGDPKDPRNSLFEEFLRLGKLFNPKLMIMENVPNLINAKTSNGEKVVDIIVKELENEDYFVYKKILTASDYGVPQTRKRLFIIASKKELENPFPKQTHEVKDSINDDKELKKCPTLWDAISDLNVLEAREGGEILEYEHKPNSAYQKYIRFSSNHLYNHKAMNHTKRVVERFTAMSCGESISDVPDHLKPFERNGKGKISTKV